MGRVIRTENLATERNRLMKAMALAMRELTKLAAFNSQARDLAAFLVLALDSIAETIERSVEPWEKRDYWLKADRFRMEWAWVEPLRKELRQAVQQEDPAEITVLLAVLSQRLKDVKISERHRLGTPWQGAWAQFTAGR
ncbi:MAG: hypothetical protein KIS85_09585 [Anaerolineales bacterium]|nr:hypothetical protein [Anaerolineales bacterium]